MLIAWYFMKLSKAWIGTALLRFFPFDRRYQLSLCHEMLVKVFVMDFFISLRFWSPSLLHPLTPTYFLLGITHTHTLLQHPKLFSGISFFLFVFLLHFCLSQYLHRIDTCLIHLMSCRQVNNLSTCSIFIQDICKMLVKSFQSVLYVKWAQFNGERLSWNFRLFHSINAGCMNVSRPENLWI